VGFLISAGPSPPLSNSFFICSLEIGFLPFRMDYASNVARFSEVFYKCSNALFSSVKAGSEIMENGLIVERRRAKETINWRLSDGSTDELS